MNNTLLKTKQFLKDKIVKQHVFDSLPQDDIMDRQRFIVFRLFSIFGSFICLAIAFREYVDLEYYSLNIYLVVILSVFLIINYLRINHAIQLKIASTLMLIATIFLLHVVSYTSGGIQNAGTLFYGVVIIYAFMLLGSKGGVFITSIVFLNGIYIYYISNYTNLTSNSLFQGNQKLINNDFITNLIFTSVLFAVLSDYMQNGRKHLISHLIKTRDEVKEKNEALFVNNNILEKKNLELDKFASIASHDLRSPLRAIGSLSDMILEDDANLSNDTKERLGIIRNRVHRMDELLNALLDYSRADRGVKKLAITDVNQLIPQIIERRKNEKPVIVSTHNLPIFKTNSSKLEQVFDILITNSIRFNKEKQVNIEISSTETEKHFSFLVKDDGPGIDPKFHDKIFVIFQTLETRDKFESSGAGLAIAKKIVDENGGMIKVNSNIGEGSCFEFTWKKIAA
jgi:signal transduction histidine kinase